MNILPKKRWHVRTKDNIARVRRDEAQAALEEEAMSKRIALAEQEARTSLLRSRVTSDALVQFENTSEHVNLFADIEQQERTSGRNKEHELEKKNEKEAEEKRIGLLKYLGEGSSEYCKETPWYEKVPQRPDPAKERNIIRQISASPANSVASNMLQRLLPSNRISENLYKRKESVGSKKRRKRRYGHSSDQSSSSEEEYDSQKTRSSTIDRLREERLRREQAEKLRSEELMRKLKKNEKYEDVRPNDKKYEQKYSSQFNPHIARQNL